MSSLLSVTANSYKSRVESLYMHLQNPATKITPEHGEELNTLQIFHRSLPPGTQKQLDRTRGSDGKELSLKMNSLGKWIWATKTCGEKLKYYADSAISPITQHPLRTISSVAIGALTHFYTGGIGYPVLTGLASYLGSSYLPNPTAPLPLPALASHFRSSLKMEPSLTRKILRGIARTAKSYPFTGYGVREVYAASHNAVPAIKEGKMNLTRDVVVPGIGCILNRYTWKSAPSIHATVPSGIKNAAVRLPQHVSAEQFDTMRQIAQAAVIPRSSVSPEVAQELAFSLGGIVIEATLPYRAGTLLKDKRPDEEIHCIFQTALNFAGMGAGGMPLTNKDSVATYVRQFSLENAKTAVTSALANKSDVLVFNLGIGAELSGGNYRNLVKQANIDGICEAVKMAQQNGGQIEVVVSDARLNITQKEQLRNNGIHIIIADKAAVAALCARQTLRVSETIAGDPMSMLGIHGPGFLWETMGSETDEERAAFLTPCYALGHIPIDVLEVGKAPKKIAAISEYMILRSFLR